MSKTIEERFQDFRLTGDTQALADVFDATAPVLGRVAGHLSSTQAMAEDLLQETFLAAIQSADRYDPERALMPWLLGLMSNHARRAHRREQRKPDPDRLSPQDPAPPEDEVMADELRRSVAQVISTMPEPYREVLTLHIQEEHPPVQVAQRLGRSGSTIRTQIQRGLDLLRKGIPAGLAPAILPPLVLDQVRVSVLQRATAHLEGTGSLAGSRSTTGSSSSLGSSSVDSSTVGGSTLGSLVGIKAGLMALALALLGGAAWQYDWATMGTLANGELDEVERNFIEEDPVVLSAQRGQREKATLQNRVLVESPASIATSVKLGDMEFFPVKVPDGPLLFSIGYGAESGMREKVHYMQAPANRGNPQVFLRCGHNARVKHRIDHRRILIKNHGDPYGLMVLDLPTAKVTQLQTKTNNELVSVRDGRILFQVNVVATGHGFRTEVPSGPFGSYFLWSYDPATGSPAKRIFDIPVARHWIMSDGKIIAMPAVAPLSIWRIDPLGQAHVKLLVLPAGSRPDRAKLTPDGRRLAVGLSPYVFSPDLPASEPGAPETIQRPKGFSLRIYDLVTKTLIREVADIDLDVSPLSSSFPRLEFVWLDDKRIRYSETYQAMPKIKEGKLTKDQAAARSFFSRHFRYVDLDVDSGKRLAETHYSDGGLSHSVPPMGPVVDLDVGKRHPFGMFDLEGPKIYYRGANEPLIDTNGSWEWPRYSPDRRFLIATRSKPKWQAVIFDGKTRGDERLTDWRTEFMWLPAAR